MSGKYDEEKFYDDVLQIVKDNVNAKLLAIDAEKGDFVTDAIPATRYLETLNDEALNFPSLIYHGIINQDPRSTVGRATGRNVGVYFDVLFLDEQSGGSDKARRKVMRYTRALREVIEEKSDSLSYAGDLEITSFQPASLKSLENEIFYRVGGITVTGVLA